MFNSNHVRTMREAKNTQARVSKYSGNGNNLPFLEPRELLDGTYRGRLWPSDAQKNPLGYLFYRSHKLLDTPNPPVAWQCPRSSNWDPIPTHYEDDDGNQFFGDDADPETMFPVFKERCWACEIEEQFAAQGLELDDCSGSLQVWMKALLGDGKYSFPMTWTVDIFSKEMIKNEETGKEWPKVEYQANPSARFNCIFSLKDDSALATELLDLIEETPDCNDMTFGRWFVLQKQNGGKGVGGYKLRIESKPSPAGFELPAQGYPNFSSWGKGNVNFKKPSKRKTYAEIEALGSAPGRFWIPELHKLKIIISDADDTPEPKQESKVKVTRFGADAEIGFGCSDDDIPF